MLQHVHEPAIEESLRQHAYKGIFSVNAGPHLISVRQSELSHHMLGTAEKVPNCLTKCLLTWLLTEWLTKCLLTELLTDCLSCWLLNWLTG